MTRWIHTSQATLLAIKHSPELVQEYQYYLDEDLGYSIITRDNEDDPFLEFDEWLEQFNEEMNWQTSDELKLIIDRELDKD